MSLQELSYVNVKRTENAASRSLLDPPYNFRPTTLNRRAQHVDNRLHDFTVSIPEREDWIFTGALARPSVAGKITRYLSSSSDRLDNYESDEEEDDLSDEDQVVRRSSIKQSKARAKRAKGRKRGGRSN